MDDNRPPEVKALIDDVVNRTPNKYAKYNYRGYPHQDNDAMDEILERHPVAFCFGLMGATTLGYVALLGPVGVAIPALLAATVVYHNHDKRTEAEKQEAIRKRVINVFDEIQEGEIDFHDQREILPYICQSPKLANLKPETIKNIIQNIRVDKDISYKREEKIAKDGINGGGYFTGEYEYIRYASPYSATSVLESLIDNIRLDTILPKYNDIIESKIDTLQDTHEKRDALKDKLYVLKKGNQLTQNISQINLKIDKEITPKIKTLKDNLDDVVKKLHYSSEEITALKDLMGVFEAKIDAIKDPSEKLAELEAFQEILKPLAEIAKEPEFINALKAMHKGYKIDVDFNRQLKVLQKILSEKLPNNEVAQEKIVKFAKGYQGALSQLYELAPGFSSSVLSTNVGKKATMIKMVSTALNTACSDIPVAKTGAALVCGELDKMAASQSANIIRDIRALGDVADGQTVPDDRADKDKKNVALQVINQHVLHMATHLSEDPQKLNQLEEGTVKSTKKLKDYHGKALESLRGIAEDIDIINSGDASSGNIVSETLHQRIENITPIEEVSCRMTAYALTSPLPAFMHDDKSRTKKEATIRAVDLRNILHSNTPSNNNNQGQNPYRPHNRFGNMGI